MLAIRDLSGNPILSGTITFNTIVGIEGVICGLSAVYLAIAEVLNETHGRAVLPIYPVK